jgi:hypothetical protein
MENYMELAISILSGLAVCIPLVIKLVEYIKKAVQEKNWGNLLTIVMNLMAEAEGMFDKGSDKKEWVMNSIQAMSSTINYEIDMKVVSELIDNLCKMSKQVNGVKVDTAE